MVSKLPKKHHYVPQFYLKGFSLDQKNLHIFDKRTTDEISRFRNQSIEAMAYEKYLYTYLNKKKTKETLEDFFSEIEGKAKDSIEKLEKQEELNLEEKSYLALFISLLWVRTPTFKKETLNAQEEMHKKMARMMFQAPKDWIRRSIEEMGKTISDEELEDLIDFATNEDRSTIEMTFPQEYWLKRMLTLGNDMYPIFASFDWEIRHTTSKFAFLTSDNPVMLIPSKKIPFPYGVGLLVPGVKKVLPLSSNLCLVMHEPKEEPIIFHTTGDKDFFRMVNEFTVKNADRYIFSPDKGKIERIVKTKPDLVKPWDKRYTVS